ncbi:hypothetical protein IMZ48_43690 [Candidatus Bathyarchaeota archaeon]|nr:hypothetical protein [Candidatus Bathyarchaeota archaeon]
MSIQPGAGESGKSTVLKQMKLIHANGFSNAEKLEWKPVVFNNVVQSFQLIFEAMNEMDVVFENPENEASRPLPPLADICPEPRVLALSQCSSIGKTIGTGPRRRNTQMSWQWRG